MRWLVAVGDTIVIDQPIAEVETAKSVVEVPSPFAGTVAVLHGAEGELLLVGAPFVEVGDPDGAAESADAAESAGVEAEAYRAEEQAGSGNVLIGFGTKEAHTGGRKRRPRGAPAVASRVRDRSTAARRDGPGGGAIADRPPARARPRRRPARRDADRSRRDRHARRRPAGHRLRHPLRRPRSASAAAAASCAPSR